MTEKQVLFICGRLDSDVMEKFEIDEEGLYYNPRLESEIKRRKAFSESRRQNRMSKPETSNTSLLHKETETESENSIVFAKPNIHQIKTYLKNCKHPDFADKFYNYYEANGWIMGNHPMKNWRAACNMWASRERVEVTSNTREIQKADLTDWKDE